MPGNDGLAHTYVEHTLFITIVGVGKERRILIGPW